MPVTATGKRATLEYCPSGIMFCSARERKIASVQEFEESDTAKLL
jgi:hypothetical protein